MKTRTTYGELYGPAMEIQSQSKADECFETLVRQLLEARARSGESQDVDEAMKIVRSNLGYYAGYYDAKTRERVERLFKCQHPVFGAIAERGQPTPKEAFDMGVKWIKGEA